MARHRRTRYVITVTAEDGNTEVFGPWLSLEQTATLADKLRVKSSRYGGDGAEFAVTINRLDPWPGIRAITQA
jgi:hypothetical protein